MKHRYAAVNKFDSSSPGLVYKDLLLYYLNFDLSYRQYRRRNPLERKQNWTCPMLVVIATSFSTGYCKGVWRPVVWRKQPRLAAAMATWTARRALVELPTEE
jgi:hypothetical protein